MESVAALSLACNIMQLISFSHGAISMCKQVYTSGSPFGNTGLDETAQTLAEQSVYLAGELRGQPPPLSNPDKLLANIADKCASAVRDLREEVMFLTQSQKDLRAAIAAVAKTAWRKRRLQRLEKSMNDWQKTSEFPARTTSQRVSRSSYEMGHLPNLSRH